LSFSNSPVEILEAEQPLMVEKYAFVPNSGGAGKFRGGLAIERSYRLVGVDTCLLQIRTDRQRFLPYGLAGGKPGTPSRNVLNPGVDEQLVPSKGRIALRRGDVFHHTTAGAAGWGDPLDRDPERVLADVRNHKHTRDYAEREYGVVMDSDAMNIDREVTAQLREALRELRVGMTDGDVVSQSLVEAPAPTEHA
jgi:N-methylhydantoinase B